MKKIQDYVGTYYFMGLIFDLKASGDQLTATVPGVPDGFDVQLEFLKEDQYRTIGGPLDGSTLTFIRNEIGDVTGIQVAAFELVKISAEKLETLPVVERFPVPVFELTPEKRAVFERLLKTGFSEAQGDWIDYDLPYPKHEFVQYVTSQNQIIFHGSNKMDIKEFLPIRKSIELHDKTGRGNIQGVYGTHDGLWSMFFAIVDRKRLQGSIRNGVMYFHNLEGEQIAVYNFSINQDQLLERPYTTGALYFLPRDTFKRLKLTAESYANEWVSEESVIPITKLKIEPEDFPFLDVIGGHDDGEIIRMNRMSEQIREAAIHAILSDDYFEVTIARDSEIAESFDEYVEMQRVMTPAAKFEVQSTERSKKLVIKSMPAAFQDMLRSQYQDLLAGE
jgi:hypothetical protein